MFIESLSFSIKRKILFDKENKQFLKEYKKQENIKETLGVIITLRNQLSHRNLKIDDYNGILKKALFFNKKKYEKTNNKKISEKQIQKKIKLIKKELNYLHNNQEFEKRFTEKIKNNKKINKLS